ncbi:hypothetical protein PIB30_064678 [Stylosanthes scabra]|uniref:Uncharacterized protein n=1 Tax=Stylosanthes scabra TaxID=79078 RepID=A0ABU6UQJ2_9FABA|nr:hypothetical protein [Stylosanthes scabra]
MSGRFSRATSDDGKNGAEELTNGKTSVITTYGLPHITKECEPWISCMIVALNVGRNDWSYSACVLGLDVLRRFKVEVMARD